VDFFNHFSHATEVLMRMNLTNEIKCSACDQAYKLGSKADNGQEQLVVSGHGSTLNQALAQTTCQACSKEDGLPSLVSILKSMGYSFGSLLITEDDDIIPIRKPKLLGGDDDISSRHAAAFLGDDDEDIAPRSYRKAAPAPSRRKQRAGQAKVSRKRSQQVQGPAPRKNATSGKLSDVVSDDQKTALAAIILKAKEERLAKRTSEFEAAMSKAKGLIGEARKNALTQDVSDLATAYQEAVAKACQLDPSQRKKAALMKVCGGSRKDLRSLSIAYYISHTATPGSIPFEPRIQLSKRSGGIVEVLDVPVSICAYKSGSSVRVDWKSSKRVEVVRFNQRKSDLPEPNKPIPQVQPGSTSKVAPEVEVKVKIIYPDGQRYGDSPRVCLDSNKYAFDSVVDERSVEVMGQDMLVQMQVVDFVWHYFPVFGCQLVQEPMVGSVSSGLSFPSGNTCTALFDLSRVKSSPLTFLVEMPELSQALLMVVTDDGEVFEHKIKLSLAQSIFQFPKEEVSLPVTVHAQA
jgi:hypothetical protein